LLVLTGERPEVNPLVAERLRSWGHEDFTSYVRWACERALERGMLPHTNVGVAGREDYARLREVTASQGLMLESVSERLMETVHAGSPTKHPRVRLEAIATAGELEIPFTSGILVGIGETEEERVASLEALAALQRRHGHIQEVILQNFVAHPRYYGAEVADIAAEASERRWSEGPGEGGSGSGEGGTDWPAWAEPVSIDDMKRLVAECRRLMPEVGVQIPPNLSDWWIDLVEAGATDLGGLSANGDHISPEHPFPSPLQVRKRLRPLGYALTERLCVYPQYMNDEWVVSPVLDVIRERFPTFLPRRAEFPVRPQANGNGGAPALGTGDPVHRAVERGRAGRELTEEELVALFAETRPEAVEEIRAAADELRAEVAGDLATFVVNRNINFTNVCTVGCAFCGFGQTSRSPDAYEIDPAEFAERIREAVEFGATEICMQGGIHPDYTLEHYGEWLRRAKEAAPDIHLHAYSPMEVHFMCERSGRDPDYVFGYLRDRGLGSTPGTAAEVLEDGVRNRISPNKLPAGRWVEIIEASHRAGLRSTSTVMFGHIETPRELAEHMRVIRAVQERTGGITEFVPLSFIPYHTMLGRTHGIEEISDAENLKHTADFRLALGRSIPNLQASWVKMGLGAATEALRGGVNDLGGTLMEESISRMAGSQHGSRLEPADLIGAARAAGRRPAQRSTRYEVLETY
jgi:FO synthase